MKQAEDMTRTKIVFGRESREKLLRGVNIIADAVASTLGPRGQNVAIARFVPKTGEIYDRTVLHDGVSVARAIDLPDEEENMGAQLLKEASQKQVDKVGDGTTAVMILARAIIQECDLMVSSGINPMSLRKGLEQGAAKLCKKLDKMSTPIKGLEDMKQIATISAEDEELGALVADTLDKVGSEGVVDVVESKHATTTMELQEGMQLDAGYRHQLFVTNPDRMEATLENTYVLVTDKPITTLQGLAKLIDSMFKSQFKLVVITPDLSGEALELLVQHKLAGRFISLGIKAPSFGEDQKSQLQDIAILTGGKFITEDAGMKFEDVTIDDLGFAEYVTATKSETIISGGKGKKDAIETRIAQIKKQITDETQEFDREKMKARLGKLTSGVAVIRVGGLTEVEMKERTERVKDAIAATRAAMQEGIVLGGEMVYLHLRKYLSNSVTDIILKKALYEPFRQLLHNAAISEVEAMLQLATTDDNHGIDVTDGKVKDFVAEGIVDPVAVPYNAIQNAVSVAIQIITTGAIITPNKVCDQN